jgi:hypothetical protein
MIAVDTLVELRPLSPAGWTVMIGCISLVLVLGGFCFWRVMRRPSPTEHLHGPLDIDTQDVD